MLSTRSLFLLAALTLCPALAQANLQVFPTRLLLTESKRVAQLSLRQLSDKPVRYKISLVYFKMNPDGSVTAIEDPAAGEQTAAKIIRFSPREVTLPPNTEQIVRVMSYQTGALSEGDYRIHVKFEPMNEGEAASEAGGEKVTMRLEAKVSVAVPVIFRKGSALTKASLSDLKLVHAKDGSPEFALKLHKEGPGFLFGDMSVQLKEKGGTTLPVANVNGLASYIPERTVRFPLTLEKGREVKGSLLVEYRKPVEEGGELLTSESIELK